MRERVTSLSTFGIAIQPLPNRCMVIETSGYFPSRSLRIRAISSSAGHLAFATPLDFFIEASRLVFAGGPAKCVEATIDVHDEAGRWAPDYCHASHFRPSAADIGVTFYNYETAVYVEDVQTLAAEILAAIGKATEHMPNDHVRNAVIGASLITAAQTLDGLPMPMLWKRGGITGMIRHMAAKWL